MWALFWLECVHMLHASCIDEEHAMTCMHTHSLGRCMSKGRSRDQGLTASHVCQQSADRAAASFCGSDGIGFVKSGVSSGTAGTP
eukprot:881691-Pelagomonas_calceolata.AAC.1